MAHELEIRDGRASFFQVNASGVVTAWHKLGAAITEPPVDVDDALAKCRGDFGVQKYRTLVVVAEDGDGRPTETVESERAFVVMRTDRMLELATVGPDYEVIQNREQMIGLDPLIKEGVVSVQTGGVLRDGGTVWLLGKVNWAKVAEHVAGTEKLTETMLKFGIDPFVFYFANHDGTAANRIGACQVEIVCANTARVAFGQSERAGRYVEVHHRGNAAARAVEASEQFFRVFVEQNVRLAEHYDALKAKQMSEVEWINRVLDVAAPFPKENSKGEKPQQFVLDRVAERRNRLTALFEGEAIGHSGDRNAWEAYRAVTQSIDHDRETWSPRVSGMSRVSALLQPTGTLRRIKDSVFTSLVRLTEGDDREMAGVTAGEGEEWLDATNAN